MSQEPVLALVFGVTLVLALGVVVVGLLHQRRREQSRLAALRGFATALRDALAIDASLEPAHEPFRAGMWAIAGVLYGGQLRALVGAGVVLLDLRLPGLAGAGWDLVPTREFRTRGGLYDDPADPHRDLDPAVLGPGWSVRGVDAERKADQLSPAIRALLTTDRAAPPWVLGGWLRTHWTGDDVAVAATWIRDLAARLAL